MPPTGKFGPLKLNLVAILSETLSLYDTIMPPQFVYIAKGIVSSKIQSYTPYIVETYADPDF